MKERDCVESSKGRLRSSVVSGLNRPMVYFGGGGGLSSCRRCHDGADTLGFVSVIEIVASQLG